MTAGREAMPHGPKSGWRGLAAFGRVDAPVRREAARILDHLISNATAIPGDRRHTFSVTLSAAAYDRLALWLAVKPAPTSVSGCPVATVQREAVDLLPAIMDRVSIIRPLPSGRTELFFTCGEALLDQLMMWGASIEDLEILYEDD